MKTYVVYYHCPFCKHQEKCGPCDNPNEMLYADNATEARNYFNAYKPCRHMKIKSIKEFKED